MFPSGVLHTALFKGARHNINCFSPLLFYMLTSKVLQGAYDKLCAKNN